MKNGLRKMSPSKKEPHAVTFFFEVHFVDVLEVQVRQCTILRLEWNLMDLL